MPVDALVPNDPRVEHKFASVAGHRYHYMLAKPQNEPVATAVLIHGWPDLGMGWRNQVPLLLSLNLQVIVPDMLGYGQTSAPDSYEEYTMKKMTGHIATIIKEHTDQPVILGGHDWGGVFVWRMVAYYPELVRAVFSLCVPYPPPSPVKMTLDELVHRMPFWRYQIQLASPIAEDIVDKSPQNLRGFVNGIFGGRTPEGQGPFKTGVGIIEENLPRIGPAALASPEIVDYYVQEYSRHGMHAPCNWYRTRSLNGDDDVELAKTSDGKIRVPAMLVMAERDATLPLSLARGQEKYFEAGYRYELVPRADHWAHVQYPELVNRYITEFVESVLGSGFKASL